MITKNLVKEDFQYDASDPFEPTTNTFGGRKKISLEEPKAITKELKDIIAKLLLVTS